MQKMRESQGDAMRQAQYQATIGSGQEAQRMFGMDTQARQQQFGERGQQGAFANQASQQALQQQLGLGGQRYQESLGGGQFSNAQRQQQMQEMLGLGQAGFQNQLAGAGFGNQAQQQGFQQAMQGGQQDFSQQMQASQYQNQLRQQQIAEQLQQRGWSLNEINALISGQQVSMPNMPGFNTAQRSETPQYNQAAQNQFQADMQQFGANQAQTQGMMSGLGSLGGLAMMSERIMKRGITRIGTTPGGTPLYRYRYALGGPERIGVMSDEAPADAIVNVGGLRFVDYGRIV
jgi:hypothetical protein